MLKYKDKQNLRMHVREQRITITKSQKEHADQVIEKTIFALPEYQKAATIFIYVSKLDEVRTINIIEDALKQGKSVIIPRVIGPMRMSLHYFTNWEDLVENKMGIYEPSLDAPQADLSAIDCAIVPTLACSKNKDRLGYGGGYYDFFLKEYAFTKIAICYEQFIFDEIPTRRYDVPMDIIITESTTYR